MTLWSHVHKQRSFMVDDVIGDHVDLEMVARRHFIYTTPFLKKRVCPQTFKRWTHPSMIAGTHKILRNF